MSNYAPQYRVQVFDMTGANFGPGNLLAEFEKAKNVGWADYLNDVPEAFFTINQDDSKVQKLRPYRDNAHVKVFRDNVQVHGGILGEWDANERDVILYSFGYLSLFYLLLTDWNVLYTNATIKTIVDDHFTRAKTTLTSSLAGWLTSGTTEAPVTTSGGATAITLPTLRLFNKKILFLFRELAAIGMGNTTNAVVYEVTPTGTFNFWKSRATDRTQKFQYGDHLVAGYSESQVPLNRRNDLLGMGMNPNDVVMRQQITDSEITTKGRRQEPVFFSWVRDSTELDRVLKLRAAKGLRDQPDLSIRTFPNAITPPGVNSGLILSDRVPVKIDRGVTNIDGLFRITGQQTYWVQDKERTKLYLDSRSGT